MTAGIESMKKATMRQIRECFMEYLDDGQPHTMAEINLYVRKKLAEASLTIPGKYGDSINLAILSFLRKPDCPYKRVRHGVYQKDDPGQHCSPVDSAYEFLNRCFELDEYAQKFFSEGLPYPETGEESRQCYSAAKERIPQLLDEVLTYASAITAIAEEIDLKGLREMPKKDVPKRRNSYER